MYKKGSATLCDTARKEKEEEDEEGEAEEMTVTTAQLNSFRAITVTFILVSSTSNIVPTTVNICLIELHMI